MQRADDSDAVLSYEDLLTKLAEGCDGFSGAAIAGVARAAASRALERAVAEFSPRAFGARVVLFTVSDILDVHLHKCARPDHPSEQCPPDPPHHASK